VNELLARQVIQLLELLQWTVSEPDEHGLIAARARYGAERLIYCPSLQQRNLRKLLRNMPRPPDWVILSDAYEIDSKMRDAVLALGVRRVMRLWQFMDETFRSQDQAGAAVDDTPAPQTEDGAEPRSYGGVFEKYIRQSYRGDLAGDDSLNLCLNLEPAENGLLLMVLAQAGYGKTWLTKAYTYAAANRYRQFRGHDVAAPGSGSGLRPPPIPFLIPFGEYRRLASFGAMVRERMEAVGVPEYTTNAFKHLLT